MASKADDPKSDEEEGDDTTGQTEVKLSTAESEEFDIEGLEGDQEPTDENESLAVEVGTSDGPSADEWEGEELMAQDFGGMRTRLSDIEEEGEDGEEEFQSMTFDLQNEMDEDEEGEADFLANYAEEYSGEQEEGIIPSRVPITAQSLEEMIRILEAPEETEVKDDDEDLQDDDYDEFFKPRPVTVSTQAVASSDQIAQCQESDGKVVVLGPDHPRMQRFQAALKRHLQKQIYLEECQLRDLEVELKIKRKEREDVGEQLYNLQYELTRQSEYMERQEEELQELTEKRTQVDAESAEIVLMRQQAEEELQKEMQEEKRLMKATKEMDLMEWCIREAIRDYESQLLISQRVDERFQKLKIQAEVEKRDQEVYLDRLMIRLQQMDQSNAALQRQIQAHGEEQKELNAFIAEATTEIEALQIEKGHLQRAWNETIAVVRSRDEALAAARKTIEATSEDLRLKETEIKQLMRAITKEQENHEKATVRLKRRKMEERNLKTRAQGFEGQVAELQSNLSMLQQIKQQVQEEFGKAMSELKGLENLIDAPRHRIQKLLVEKKTLEDEILKIIQEQTAMDKVAQGIARQIYQAREKTRLTEDEMAKVENDVTRANYECEVLRTDLLKKQTALGELEKKLKVQEALLQTQAVQIKYSERVLQKKNTEVQVLTTKLQKLTEEQENLGIGRLEEEVQELERQVTANRTICIDLQEKWLKLQDELVSLTIKRDQILSENDLRRKEEFILERKRQRLQAENDQKQEEIIKLQRAIKQAQMEINLLNSKLYQGKEEQEAMERDNILLQNELVNVLKDAEFEAIELQDEIGRLEAEKERLSKDLAEAHDQCLIWERKVKMAKELKESIKKEQESSMTQLRLAIHHMQVRHNELRRVQEKLMADMERSIDKRERIIQQADFNLKRNNLHPNSTLIHVQREEVNVKQKRKKILEEAKQAEAEVKQVEENISQLEDKIKCEMEALRKIKTIIDSADDKLSEAAIEKHKNLIEVILRQIKYKTLESVNLKRFEVPSHPKQVEEEIRKLEERCYSIVELCDALLEEYPDYKLPIKLIKASILPDV